MAGSAEQFADLAKFPQAGRSVIRVPVDLITPNPAQPRKLFSEYALLSLSDSIKRHGIIQPLIVRETKSGYELIAGERRLRAGMMAGLTAVPCILWDADSDRSAELAIIENLQREDLNMFEEAQAIKSLIETCKMTQETAAQRLSCSQSYIANKLRLLRLPQEQRSAILESCLTERHARALLRIADEKTRAQALDTIIKRSMNVAAAEEYVEDLLCAKSRAEAEAAAKEKTEKFDRDFKRRMLLRDMRLFYNSIDHAVESVRNCGINVETTKSKTENGTMIHILIRNEMEA